MNGDNNRGSGVGAQLLIALALALVAGALLAVWLIGSDTLRTMGLILISGLTLALLIGASALPIRMWRRKDFTGDHYHTDGTKTIVKETRIIDGRQVTASEVKLLQLPAQPQSGAFPELLRAAYAAGATTLPTRSASRPEPDYGEAELDELDLSSPPGWDGDISA